MGQLSDPFEQAEEEEGIVISGLPGDLYDPDPPAPGPPVDTPDGDDVAPEDGGGGDWLGYDLDDWSELERQAVDDRLREAGVPHGWEGARLLVAAVDEAMVENVLDIVEGEADVPGAEPLDADRDQIAYDATELDDDALDRLVAALGEAGIAFQWGDEATEEILVYADDEDAVDAAFEAVQYPDELPAEDDHTSAGTATADLLGELFVAADRLGHDVEDVEGTASLLDAAVTIDALAPPYGMSARDWERICAGVGELSDLLVDDDGGAGAGDDDVRDDRVEASARELRATLRPFV